MKSGDDGGKAVFVSDQGNPDITLRRPATCASRDLSLGSPIKCSLLLRCTCVAHLALTHVRLRTKTKTNLQIILTASIHLLESSLGHNDLVAELESRTIQARHRVASVRRAQDTGRGPLTIEHHTVLPRYPVVSKRSRHLHLLRSVSCLLLL